MLFHFCLIQYSSCSTVLDNLCHIFPLMICQMFQWVKGLDCRQASPPTQNSSTMKPDVQVASSTDPFTTREAWWSQNLINLTTEQFSTLPRSILNELTLREDTRIFGSCSHTASFLHDRAGELAFVDSTVNCAHRQKIPGIVLEPMQRYPGKNHVGF